MRLPLALTLAASLLAGATACSDKEPDLPDAGTPDSGTPSTPAGDVAPPDRTACTGLTFGSGTYDWTVQHGGRTRVYRVHVPPGYDATKPSPVVLAFHGFSSTEQEQEYLSQLSPLADTEGFLAVYPRGLNAPELSGAGNADTRSWNAGGCCYPASTSNSDDVGFVDALLADLDTRLCVDPRRVFATGLSNGAFFSYRLACERAQRIAAIAPVAGMVAVTPCVPSRPVPVLHFHGTADNVIAYDGGTVPLGGPYPSAPESVRRFAVRNGCGGPQQQTYQQGDSTCVVYTSCAPESATASLCTVQGGGHTWPGGLVPDNLGHTTKDLDATGEMWRFFQAHPRP